MEDKEILDLFFERSEQAFAVLSSKYGRLCRQIAENVLGSAQDAEECVNDAYLALWNSIPPSRPDPLPAYLCRVVRNHSIKKHRSNTAAKRNSYYDLALDELSDCIPAADTVENQLALSELSQAIDSFLEGLDKESRVMFVRRYWFSDSIADIAALFACSPNKVAVRLHRLREKLRKKLIKEGIAI